MKLIERAAKSVVTVLVLCVVFLGLNTAALGQMSEEADQICRKQCYAAPKVIMPVPTGEGVEIAPVSKEKGGPAVEVIVHSETDSTELFCRLEILNSKEFDRIGWVRRVAYGTKAGDNWERTQNNNPISIMATVEELYTRRFIKLPAPEMERDGNQLKYMIRPCEWKQRDSGLTPLSPKEIDLRPIESGGGTYVGRNSKLSQRSCADCNSWWKGWLKANPEAWKQEKITLERDNDYQPKTVTDPPEVAGTRVVCRSERNICYVYTSPFGNTLKQDAVYKLLREVDKTSTSWMFVPQDDRFGMCPDPPLKACYGYWEKKASKAE